MPSMWHKVHDLFSNDPYSHPPQRPGYVHAQKHPHTYKYNTPPPPSDPQPGIHSSSVPDPMFGTRCVPISVRDTSSESRSSRSSREEKGGPKRNGLKRSDAIRDKSHRHYDQHRHRHRDRSAGEEGDQQGSHRSGTSTPSSAYLSPSSSTRSPDVHRFKQDDKSAGGPFPPTLHREMSREVLKVSKHLVNVVNEVQKHHSQRAVFDEIPPTVAEERRRETKCTQLNDFISPAGRDDSSSPPIGLCARSCPPGMCQACAIRPAVPEVSRPEIDLALCVKCADEEREHRRRHRSHRRRHHHDDSSRHRHRERCNHDDDSHRSRSHADHADEHRSHRSQQSSSRSASSDSHRKGIDRPPTPIPKMAEEAKNDYHHHRQATSSRSKVTTEPNTRCYVCGGPTASFTQKENKKVVNQLCSSCYNKAFFHAAQAPATMITITKHPKIRVLTPPVPAPAPAPPTPTLNSLSHRKNPPPKPPTLITGRPAPRRRDSPVSPLTPPSYYPATRGRNWAVPSSVYAPIKSPDSADSGLSTPSLTGRKHTASTYQRILSRRPTETDFGGMMSMNGGALVDGGKPSRHEGGARSTDFYNFYDEILQSPPPPPPSAAPLSFSPDDEKKWTAETKSKHTAAKSTHSCKDEDWLWETY